MSAQVVHNPQQCAAALAALPKTAENREAIQNAIACINHMANVIGKQRKVLARIAKAKP